MEQLTRVRLAAAASEEQQPTGVHAAATLTRNWAPNVRKVAEELERVFGVKCWTYANHGAGPHAGEAQGIDCMVAPWGQTANKAQEALGDRIQKYLEANWARLGLAYLIWWDWMTYSPGGWFPYDENTYTNPLASPDPDTERHMDHLHIQIRKGFVYSPPKGEAPVDEPILDVGRGVDEKALVALIDGHLNGMGRVIVDTARKADLHVDLACAVVEQESEGHNIFGGDYGDVGDRPPFYRQPVTKARVQALRTGGSYRHGMNGIGLTQLTWWEFVERAEALGGAHLPVNQCLVGFGDLVSMLDVEGFGYMEALGAYNAGRGSYQIGINNGYAGSVAARHRRWKQLISSLPKAKPAPTPEAPKPAPVPKKPEVSREEFDALARRVAALEEAVKLDAPAVDPPKTPAHEPVIYGRLASVFVAACVSYGILADGQYPELQELIAGFLAWLAADSGISVAVRQLVRPIVTDGER